MEIVAARQDLCGRHRLPADRAAVVQLRELVRVRVSKALLQIVVGLQKVAVRAHASMQRLKGELRVGEEEDVDDGEAEPVDVPYVHVVEELTRLHAELRDQRDVIERVGRAE